MTDATHISPRRAARPAPTPRRLLALAAGTFLATLLPAPSAAQNPAQNPARKPALTHEAYDTWRTIRGEAISGDGAWVLYELAPRVGDTELVVTRPGGREIRVARAGDARFTADSRFALFTIVPAHDSVRALKLGGAKGGDLPPDTLGILDLSTGEVTRVGGVRSWRVPEEAGGVVAYLLDDEPEADDEAAPDSAAAEPVPGAEPAPEPVPEVVPEPGVEPEPGVAPEPAEPESDEEKDEEREKPEGRTLVLRSLRAGAGGGPDTGAGEAAGAAEHRYADVVAYALSEDGRTLAYTTSTDDGAGDGAHVVDTGTGASRTILAGEGLYEQLAVSADGRQVAVLTDRDEFRAEQPAFALYVWRDGRDGREEARRVAAAGTPGVPAGWVVSEHGALTFSERGTRLYFGTVPRPAPAAEDTLLEEEKVTLDVWHWQDDLIQPMQLATLDEERKRSYRAVAHLDGRDRVVQLGTPELPEIRLAAEGDGDVALGESDVRYRHLVGIEAPGFSDLWLVDVRSGDRRRVVERRQVAWARPSPSGDHVAWYDYGDRHWYAAATDDARPVRVSAQVLYPVWDEEDDHPMPPSAYGMAGWTEGDGALLVYDRFDIWALDPAGRDAPRRVTEGFGRDNGLRLRHVALDEDEEAIDPDGPLLLSAFDVGTKAAGFYRDRVRGSAPPRELVMAPKRFGRPERAEQTDRLLFTREDVAEYPDLWVASPSFEDAVRVSEANPQQAEHNWATVELMEWLSTDGVPLQGLLYRPEDFHPSKRYPMMVTFYERDSDNLHEHHPPLPHRSVIRPTFYASRGYIVFVPDIVYRNGYPGESAMDAIMPGVLRLAAEPWVDEHNVGVQGHSWGGYQIAYMVTKTDFFKAAEAGAPVANMTSAYGGIRWGSGMSRMFQYERTQSRIGGTLWEAPVRYFENSPLFFLDKVETPLLIMHNDGDTAVPWYQGIELFMALRRLGKPAWMITYNDQPHWPVTAANIRDWNIRMQQFFDHYLKGAPVPVWMAEGIPATEKGRTLGLDPAEAVTVEPAPVAGGSNDPR